MQGRVYFLFLFWKITCVVFCHVLVLKNLHEWKDIDFLIERMCMPDDESEKNSGWMCVYISIYIYIYI